jgi:hypothetical protein
VARLVAAKCPNCGANVRIDPAGEYATCSYCGTSSFVQTPQRRLTDEALAHRQPAFEVSPPQHGMVLAGVVAGALVLLTIGSFVFVSARPSAPAPRELGLVSQADKLPTREPSRDWAQPAREASPPEVTPPVPDDSAGAAASGSKARAKPGPAPASGGLEPRVRAGTVTVSGRLDRAVIVERVRARHGRYRLCYEQALARNRTLRGRISVRFVIGRDGTVSNVSNGGTELSDSAMTSCVISAFYGLSFPAPEAGIVTVLYPLIFEA